MDKIIFCVIVLFMYIAPAYAYLEPGNGYILLQSLLAGIAGLAALLKIYWQQFKNFMATIWQKICKRNVPTPLKPETKPTRENKEQDDHEPKA
jgi:hypothetical protein